MTLRDLRNVFGNDTQFVLWIADADENELWMNNYLWGTDAIAGLEVMPNSVFCEYAEVVHVKTDMPLEVFRAWGKAGDA